MSRASGRPLHRAAGLDVEHLKELVPVRREGSTVHLVIDCRSIHRHLGGIGRAAWDLAAALGKAPRDHRVSVLIGSAPPEGFRIDGVEVVQVDAAMIDEPFEQLGLPGVLEDLKPDVYLNSSFSLPALKTTPFQVAIIHEYVLKSVRL